MEQVLESFYEGFGVLVFCIAVGIMFICFRYSDQQTNYVRMNIYEQHMLYGAFVD